MYSGDSSPLGGASSAAAAWQAAIAAHNAADAAEIVRCYQTFAPEAGIATDLALAQAALETGWFTSPAYRDRKNMAGIGITSDAATGYSFSSIENGAKGHLDLLRCYFVAKDALWGPWPFGGFFLGKTTLAGLDGVWAVPGIGYGQHIAAIANSVIGGSVTDGVYGEDLIAKFATQIGHATSGTYDALNGDHPWAYYCEAGVESTGRNCGLDVTARASALDKYNHCFQQGLIQSGTPEHGAQVFFGTAFYAPDGHTGLWDADKGQLLGTLTDGTGVGYRNWGPGTVGYLGWCRIPGVVAPRRAVTQPGDPPMDPGNYVPPNNPYNTGTDPNHQIGVGGANKRAYLKAPEVFGLPVTNEFAAHVFDGKMSGPLTLQVFENLVTAYDAASDTLSIVKPGARIVPKEAVQ